MKRRGWLCAGVTLAAAALSMAAGAGGIPVFDSARFTQMLLLLRQAQNLYDRLSEGLTALRNAATRLGGGGRLVDNILLGSRTLAADLSSIGYQLDTVSTQFRRVFPDEQAVRDTRPEDVAEMTRRWDHEIDQSALAAARAQTTLSTIERNTNSATVILSRSKASTAPGEGSQVAQLQALVQMIGVINSDLANLATTLATAERVNTSLAAADVSASQVNAERRRQLAGDGASPPGESPGIDRRFLEE